MDPSRVLTLAFFIGVVAGLRSLTAPAFVAWGAHRGWFTLSGTPFAVMASTGAVVFFIALAVVELAADKAPSTGSRLQAGSLMWRMLVGGLSGSAIAVAGTQSLPLGAVLGGVGAIVGAYAGHAARTGLVSALQSPDWVIAVLEDAVAIGGAFLIVSQL